MIKVVRKDNSVRIVDIMLDKNTNKYCFVNLTSKHVCKCRFNSYDEAIQDLNKDSFVKSWSTIDYYVVQ